MLNNSKNNEVNFMDLTIEKVRLKERNSFLTLITYSFIGILYYFSDRKVICNNLFTGNAFYILKIIMMMYLVEKKSLLPVAE